MYEVHHRAKHCKPGMSILWNGEEQPIEAVDEEYIRIDGTWFSREKVNEMFRSTDIPFELVR